MASKREFAWLMAALFGAQVLAVGCNGGGSDGSVTHAIAGHVTGDVQTGVTLTLGGNASATTTSGTGGSYSFTGLADGNYTVTPTLAGQVFTPSVRQVQLNGSSVVDADFVSAAASLGWSTTTVLPAARINGQAAAPGNGWVYMINGFTNANTCNLGTNDGRVFRAQPQADGSLGAWTEDAALTGTARRSWGVAATFNGFIYVAGGARGNASWDDKVWFAKANADGSLGSWTQATSAIGSSIGSSPEVAIADGYLYVGGGGIGSNNQVGMWMAQLDAATGQPGAWTRLVDLPVATVNTGLVIAGGHAYFPQGGTTNVFVSAVQADHSLGAWSLAPAALPAAINVAGVLAGAGKLYVIRGGATEVWVSTIQGDGMPGAWSLHSNTPASVMPGPQSLLVNDHLYVFGSMDCNASPTVASTVYHAPVP